MSDYTDSYRDLLIKQYWNQPNARSEIESKAATWEVVRDTLDLFKDEFDLDRATGEQLDIIGRIVGVDRRVSQVIDKIYFGFDDYDNARGFDDKFVLIEDVAPFRDKFERPYTDLQLNDTDYRLFVKAKAALNNSSGFMVSDERISIQEVINRLFDGNAYVVDKKDMRITLYLSPAFDSDQIRTIIRLGLLPKPQGVRYWVIVQAEVGETFGFSDNLNSQGFANRFDLSTEPGGRLAEKVII